MKRQIRVITYLKLIARFATSGGKQIVISDKLHWIVKLEDFGLPFVLFSQVTNTS